MWVSIMEAFCGKFSEHSKVLVGVTCEGIFILGVVPLECPGAAFCEGKDSVDVGVVANLGSGDLCRGTFVLSKHSDIKA